ncbi:MAG TPA: hypothetical protein ENI34_05525 [candidate division WOR-3 bacterium]|uniref:Uncharacterized protein n=1 Tax=candidate division WOR-3 bacterium TaxID=2052148 RepID=A0A9C9ELY6_UNCW3|nr:hypothetical protein [candidate division WOR-3 bacterium]
MIVLFFLSTLVFQKGDTLFFGEKDSVFDKLVLFKTETEEDSLPVVLVKKAKVSDDHSIFLLFEERYDQKNDKLDSKITFYTAEKKVLWCEARKNKRKISYDLSNIHDSLFIIIETDINGRTPELYIIKDGRKETIIKKGTWMRIVNYALSDNNRFLLLHTLRQIRKKAWDHICFIDLKTRETWEYLFPICLSCKRTKIFLNIDNDGRSEIVYKGEHRIFSREGQMVDLFIKPE